MPVTTFAATRPNGNGQYREIPYTEPASAPQIAEIARGVGWVASILKQSWPYIVAIVMAVFAAGVAWQKLQASQDKIEAVAKKVDAHDLILTSILEKVAEVKGIIEGQHRQFAAAPPIPAYPPQKAASAPPALPVPAAHPPRRTKKLVPPACSGLLCAFRN